MRRLIPLLIFVLLAPRAFADAPATSPSTISAPVQSALSNLSSDDYHVRKKALSDLESALAQQAISLASINDPESQASLTTALEFNNGLNHWLVDLLKLPPDARNAQLDFIKRADLLPTVSQIFGADEQKSTAAVHQLAAITDPSADVFLAHLVDNDSRAVSLAAMEVLWDRNPTDVTVDVLWQRAVESGFYRVEKPASPPPTFRGRPVPDTSGIFTSLRAARDADIACEVLIHLQAPQVEAKIDNYLQRALDHIADADPKAAIPYFSNIGPIRNIYRLIDAYKPQSALPALYVIATGRAVINYNGHNGNAHFYFSNRTAAIAEVLMLTNQNPDDYGLQRHDATFAKWIVASDAAEKDAINKLQAWHSHQEATPHP